MLCSVMQLFSCRRTHDLKTSKQTVDNALTDEFWFRLAVPEVDSRDVEHVTRVVVREVGVVGVDVQRLPVLLAQFERHRLDRHYFP